MTGVLLATCLLALTRAEIIERMRAPVVTQAQGLVQVYADCPEDMRREYQMPIASFAAETAKTLYRGLSKKPVRFRRAEIMIHIGDVRTNVVDVVTKVTTNGQRAVSRIYVKSPGYADLSRLRLEIVKAFYRSIEKTEISDAEAVAAYRRANPALRVHDERMKLEEWLAGRGTTDDETGLSLMRKVFEPGKSSRRDVLVFASRLFLYPTHADLRFMGRFDNLSFREALRYAKTDPTIRIMAVFKARELPIFGGGRSPELSAAAEAYRLFLEELGKLEMDEDELVDLLEKADNQLNIAFEKAEKL